MKTKEIQKWLDEATAEAQELIGNPSKVDELLIQLEQKLKEVPAIGGTLANLPTMIALVKAWITKEYTEISPKVIACLVGAILYLLKKKDLIDDRIPVVGIADDLAVMGLALNLCEPELNAFRTWRDNQKQEVTENV
ncbi:MAG: DUF1232 domain-containing protein [Clostridia bacterium]|nr:DUF1232 domain-containing protein [Clostridia bacterium]